MMQKQSLAAAIWLLTQSINTDRCQFMCVPADVADIYALYHRRLLNIESVGSHSGTSGAIKDFCGWIPLDVVLEPELRWLFTVGVRKGARIGALGVRPGARSPALRVRNIKNVKRQERYSIMQSMIKQCLTNADRNWF